MSEVQINQIGQIAIPVADIDRAIAFYKDILGMIFLFKAPPGLGFFDCNGVRLMLDEPAKENAGNASILYYKVENIEEVFEELVSRDVKVEASPHIIAKMPDHELWMAFIRDPDHNLLALMEEKR